LLTADHFQVEHAAREAASLEEYKVWRAEDDRKRDAEHKARLAVEEGAQSDAQEAARQQVALKAQVAAEERARREAEAGAQVLRRSAGEQRGPLASSASGSAVSSPFRETETELPVVAARAARDLEARREVDYVGTHYVAEEVRRSRGTDQLQPCATEAANPCAPFCSPVQPWLQPHVQPRPQPLTTDTATLPQAHRAAQSLAASASSCGASPPAPPAGSALSASRARAEEAARLLTLARAETAQAAANAVQAQAQAVRAVAAAKHKIDVEENARAAAAQARVVAAADAAEVCASTAHQTPAAAGVWWQDASGAIHAAEAPQAAAAEAHAMAYMCSGRAGGSTGDLANAYAHGSGIRAARRAPSRPTSARPARTASPTRRSPPRPPPSEDHAAALNGHVGVMATLETRTSCSEGYNPCMMEAATLVAEAATPCSGYYCTPVCSRTHTPTLYDRRASRPSRARRAPPRSRRGGATAGRTGRPLTFGRTTSRSGPTSRPPGPTLSTRAAAAAAGPTACDASPRSVAPAAAPRAARRRRTARSRRERAARLGTARRPQQGSAGAVHAP